MRKKSTATTPIGKFIEFIRTLVSALFFVVIIHCFLFKPFVIPSPSMVPTLLVGDYLFASKYPYGYGKYSFTFSVPFIEGFVYLWPPFEGRYLASPPKRGDVVLFRPTFRDYEDWIKRVIGLPGDRIQIINGIVHINDAAVKLEKVNTYKWRDQHGRAYDSELFTETLPNGVKHQILKTAPFGRGERDNTPAYIVPEGHYFVMGDNRDHSDDSRNMHGLGFVPFDNIVGRAEMLFFSTDIPTHPQEKAWWKVWTWPFATRYQRFLNIIR